MTDFYSDFHGVGAHGLTAEQYFYEQVFKSFSANTENHSLPFFNRNLNKIPRELSTGKIINNENSIALEQVASQHGYKSNLWIYGDELNKIQKEVGNLYCKKGTQPALCLTKYFGSTHLNEQDLYVSEGGSGKKEQYLYNLDSLDEKSQQKLLKYYEFANSVDKVYAETNMKAWKSNWAQIQVSPEAKQKLVAARERTIAASNQGGTDLRLVTQCHFQHNLGSAIGKPAMSDIHSGQQNPGVQKQCYEVCEKFLGKMQSEKIPPHKAGKMLCTALNAGTEFQRVSVAKGYNLENAKKVEEMKVAEKNRDLGYRRSGGFSY